MPTLPARGTTPGPPNGILDPTGTIGASRARPRPPRARRRQDLRGATVGLLVNTKQNAAPFLDEIGRLLVDQQADPGTAQVWAAAGARGLRFHGGHGGAGGVEDRVRHFFWSF